MSIFACLLDIPRLLGNSFKYTGQREAEAGLYFYNARYYDPEIGRFIQADTIIPEPGKPLAYDRYAYANNNPLYYSDPSGHIPLPILIAIIAFISSLVPQFSGDSYNYDYINMTPEEQNQELINSIGASLYIGTGILAAGELTIPTLNNLGQSSNITNKRIFNSKVDIRTLKVEIDINKNLSHDGEFNIINWEGYPKEIPMPKGPMRIVTGQEYIKVRQLANQTNSLLHIKNPNLSGYEIHEILPVKFGGSPTEQANKIFISRSLHKSISNWWNVFLQKMNRKY